MASASALALMSASTEVGFASTEVGFSNIPDEMVAEILKRVGNGNGDRISNLRMREIYIVFLSQKRVLPPLKSLVLYPYPDSDIIETEYYRIIFGNVFEVIESDIAEKYRLETYVSDIFPVNSYGEFTDEYELLDNAFGYQHNVDKKTTVRLQHFPLFIRIYNSRFSQSNCEEHKHIDSGSTYEEMEEVNNCDKCNTNYTFSLYFVDDIIGISYKKDIHISTKDIPDFLDQDYRWNYTVEITIHYVEGAYYVNYFLRHLPPT